MPAKFGLSIKIENYVVQTPVVLLCAAWGILMFSFSAISAGTCQVTGKDYVQKDQFLEVSAEEGNGPRGTAGCRYPDGGWIGEVSEGFPRMGNVTYLFDFSNPTPVSEVSVTIKGSASLCDKDRCRQTPNPRAVFGAQIGAWNFITHTWDYLGTISSQEDAGHPFTLRSETADPKGGSHVVALGGEKHRALIRLWFESSDPALATRYDVGHLSLMFK